MRPISASLPFIAFVVWLLAVPMDGFLLASLGIDDAILYFLFPHVVTLAVIGTVLCRYPLFRLGVAGGVVAMGATVLLPHVKGGAPWLLASAGIGSAFVCVRAANYLKRASSMGGSAAFGLMAANLLLFLFTVIPLAEGVKFYLVAALLLIPVALRSDACGEGGGEESLLSFLPFVFVFQMVSGLMYGTLYGHYARVAMVPGVEVAFYAIAVVVGGVVLRRRREMLLAMAIVAAMFAFSLYLVPTPASVNAALFAMQGAAGFLDLYVLVLLLAQRDSRRALGVGLAVACSGIIVGKGISVAIGDIPQLVVAAANIVLTTSVLLLYLVVRGERREAQRAVPAELPVAVEGRASPLSPPAVSNDFEPPRDQFTLPASLRKRFSEQEKSVLGCIVQGMTFRETARELAISESSVKTYMKRIYDKMSVSGKDELLAKLGEEPRN
uniref:LuxR family transcriptional regulator n=1 Tax=Geobacter metallireducens TaxID=28232 RepID=A0A831U0E7_GEOME